MAEAMSVRQLIVTEREKAVDVLDREARDAGHLPHPWALDDVHVTHTACSWCGQSMVVRVMDLGRIFKSGLPKPCPKSRKRSVTT